MASLCDRLCLRRMQQRCTGVPGFRGYSWMPWSMPITSLHSHINPQDVMSRKPEQRLQRAVTVPLPSHRWLIRASLILIHLQTRTTFGGFTPPHAPNSVYPGNTNTPTCTLSNSNDLQTACKTVGLDKRCNNTPPSPSNLCKTFRPLVSYPPCALRVPGRMSLSRTSSQPDGPDIEALAPSRHSANTQRSKENDKSVVYCGVS
ncbi:hypothetical protein K458DRAFT_33746 [Lentithecium fluviatile CBS 122367]|uniref:Uncharacterized protein n=1 Tax=Lentithecium fluviatile CBS 122367 TaxID=1168545 RepID=A0A6G1J232_9PLEO|nr:hypothetical protein K458DRAFT_33746 [Lentithecium fluviatile CBS 122367]